MKNPSTSFRSKSGFTLIELLVAMAITTIIITILVSITGLSLDTWNRSRSEIRAARQGKAMIDSMAMDLESMVVRKGNNFEWLYAKYAPTAQGPNGASNNSPNAADLVFFSAATDRYNGKIGDTNLDKGGDVSTIAYQLKYKDPIASGTPSPAYETFVLYRKIINPDETFIKTLGLPFVSGTPDSATLSTAAQAASADPSLGSNNDVDNPSNFICENVYQFTLTFHVAVTKPNGITVNVPVSVGNGSKASKFFKITGSGLQMDTTITGENGAITNAMVKVGRLNSIEVSLTVLTDFGLQQMRKRPLTDATKKAEFIAENSYQYTKLIPVPGS